MKIKKKINVVCKGIQMRIIWVLCALLILPISAIEKKQKFIVITSLYNETDPERIQEYIYCLEKNKTHNLIDKIHVLYDTSKDNVNNIILDYLQKNRYSISFIPKRPTFGFCFNLANTLYSSRNIIISNADIYFNNTLNLLVHYNLKNKFLALTRWNVARDGCLYANMWHGKPNTSSQDVWIFKTPIKFFEKTDFQLGTQHCDGQIAYQAQKAQFRISNPCLSIQCCHLHLSEVRNYAIHPNPEHMIKIPWSKLK